MFVELFLVLVVCGLLLLNTRRPKNFPPGPRGLPLVGYLPFLNKWDPDYQHKGMEKLAGVYGPVTGFYLGPSRVMISVCGPEAAKEALLNKDLDGRPVFKFVEARTYGQRLGMMFTDGDFWRRQRRFTLRHLRDFGFGKSSMEHVMKEEIDEALAEIRTRSEADSKRIVDFEGFFNVPVTNLLWAIVAGHRFRRDDTQFLKLLKDLETFMRTGNIMTSSMNVPPIVYRIFPSLKKYFGMDSGDLFGPIIRFFEETITEHKRSRRRDEPRDFIDVYLQEIENEQVNGTDSSFDEKQLVGCIVDIFAAGSETTVNAIGFALLYLLHHPHVQNRMQQEMDSVCGVSLPTMAHRSSLTYTEAVLMEVQRISSIAPFGVAHGAIKDTQLQGFTIPKDSIVLINFYSVNSSVDIWKDPHLFRPERHLNSEGQIDKSEHFYPFGIGKRTCLGEPVARNSFYLFVTSLIKSFTFSAVPGRPLPTLEPRNGFTLGYKGFEAVVAPR
nr:CYP370A1 protein [Diaphanosoma celebensis]